MCILPVSSKNTLETATRAVFHNGATNVHDAELLRVKIMAQPHSDRLVQQTMMENLDRADMHLRAARTALQTIYSLSMVRAIVQQEHATTLSELATAMESRATHHGRIPTHIAASVLAQTQQEESLNA